MWMGNAKDAASRSVDQVSRRMEMSTRHFWLSWLSRAALVCTAVALGTFGAQCMTHGQSECPQGCFNACHASTTWAYETGTQQGVIGWVHATSIAFHRRLTCTHQLNFGYPTTPQSFMVQSYYEMATYCPGAVVEAPGSGPLSPDGNPFGMTYTTQCEL